jgi:hypothetical protein
VICSNQMLAQFEKQQIKGPWSIKQGKGHKMAKNPTVDCDSCSKQVRCARIYICEQDEMILCYSCFRRHQDGNHQASQLIQSIARAIGARKLDIENK